MASSLSRAVILSTWSSTVQATCIKVCPQLPRHQTIEASSRLLQRSLIVPAWWQSTKFRQGGPKSSQLTWGNARNSVLKNKWCRKISGSKRSRWLKPAIKRSNARTEHRKYGITNQIALRPPQAQSLRIKRHRRLSTSLLRGSSTTCGETISYSRVQASSWKA